jgi:hypothetical protein
VFISLYASPIEINTTVHQSPHHKKAETVIDSFLKKLAETNSNIDIMKRLKNTAFALGSFCPLYFPGACVLYRLEVDIKTHELYGFGTFMFPEHLQLSSWIVLLINV